MQDYSSKLKKFLRGFRDLGLIIILLIAWQIYQERTGFFFHGRGFGHLESISTTEADSIIDNGGGLKYIYSGQFDESLLYTHDSTVYVSAEYKEHYDNIDDEILVLLTTLLENSEYAGLLDNKLKEEVTFEIRPLEGHAIGIIDAELSDYYRRQSEAPIWEQYLYQENIDELESEKADVLSGKTILNAEDYPAGQSIVNYAVVTYEPELYTQYYIEIGMHELVHAYGDNSDPDTWEFPAGYEECLTEYITTQVLSSYYADYLSGYEQIYAQCEYIFDTVSSAEVLDLFIRKDVAGIQSIGDKLGSTGQESLEYIKDNVYNE